MKMINRLAFLSIGTVRYFSQNSSSDILRKALKTYTDIRLVPYRIGGCELGESFSNAHIQVIQYLEDRNGRLVRPLSASMKDIITGKIITPYVKFRSVFDRGFTNLESYLNGGKLESLAGHEHGEKYDFEYDAIKSLLRFMSRKDFHEECLEQMIHTPSLDCKHNKDGYYICKTSGIPEAEITALLANHLLSQLAANNNTNCNGREEKYIISRHTKKNQVYCPCVKKCGVEIKYGNTEFGSPYLWYGKADIILFPVGGGGCSIIVPEKHVHNYTLMEEEDPFETERQITEIKAGSSALRNYNNVKKIVSQAITFSFYQTKFQQLNKIPKVNFIPTIVACQNAFDVYMYDCEKDILLRNQGEPIPLFLDGNFNLSAVIQLWILINHALFTPSLYEEALKKLSHTCGLRKQMEGLEEGSIEVIMETLEMRENFKADVDPDFDDVQSRLIEPLCESKKRKTASYLC